MGAIGYLYGRTFANRLKKAFRKPVTYVYLFFILIYFAAVPLSLRMVVEELGADSPEGMTTVLTILAFWIIPANLIAYAKRKGLVYRSCDVHFLFPSPVSPKRILLYAHLKTLTMQILLNLFAIACGRLLFHVEGWRLGLYFFFSIFVENVLEGCIMVLLYGSERIGEKWRGMVVKAAYVLAGILAAMGFAACAQKGFRLETLWEFLHSDGVQLVPLVGWYIAVVHLIFAGAAPASVAGSVCYGAVLMAVAAAAARMRCTGAFYEDAMKFAEDYEEVLESRQKGTLRRPGRKPKFGRANVRWRGPGARALFSRQLLEYKKSRYFIFDINTVTALFCGVGMVYLCVRTGGFGKLGEFGAFVIPVVSAYAIFLFTSINGKWAKELLNPYTYLIPDTVFRKLIYATAMQVIQAFINACVITIPPAIVMGLPPGVTVLSLLFYTTLSANKLYALAVAEAAAGNTLGRVGRQLIQMLIQSMALLAAVTGGVMGMAVGGVTAAYVLMDLFLVLITVICMVIAALNFYNMETS